MTDEVGVVISQNKYGFQWRANLGSTFLWIVAVGQANVFRTLRHHRVSHREETMPTFLCFLNWTDQGAKNTKDIVKRYQASKAVVEKLGGRLLSVYVTTGQYDVVVTVEMPNGETMMKYVSAISATGNARTTTVRGYSPEEFSKLAAEAPSM
jgi:uncharacterized protein with GYD domain